MKRPLWLLLVCSSWMPACGGEDGEGADGDADIDSDSDADPRAWLRELCVQIINDYRATEDKPPYLRWTEAEQCTDEEAASDAETGEPHGAFGQCGERAQNECPGWPGPIDQLLEGCLASMWAEGPGEPFEDHGHYLNMSSTQFTRVACGFASARDGSIWAVQNFR